MFDDIHGSTKIAVEEDIFNDDKVTEKDDVFTYEGDYLNLDRILLDCYFKYVRNRFARKSVKDFVLCGINLNEANITVMRKK